MSNASSATLLQRWLAEFIGTAFLLATVVGSGIMAEQLSNGLDGLALLANAIATGAILYVLITIFGPVSGAHFNPAVTMGFWLRKDIQLIPAMYYAFAQFTGAIVGVIAAHMMFAMPVVLLSTHERSSMALSFSELIATFGLMLIILMGIRHNPKAVPALVGLYITAAYWFTASTSFANPAVTIARSLTESFSGIQYTSTPWFILMQLLGVLLAVLCCRVLLEPNEPHSEN